MTTFNVECCGEALKLEKGVHAKITRYRIAVNRDYGLSSHDLSELHWVEA